MFGFFKKAPPERRPTREVVDYAAPPRRAKAPVRQHELPSLPEVTEGNTEADWSAWEDSVAFQESTFNGQWMARTQPSPLTPSDPSASDAIFEREAQRK